MKKKVLPIIKNDPWLEPFADAINGRHEDVIRKQTELVGESGSLSDFANAHNYFGLHRTADGWVFREWAPNATAINMVGTFNDWVECEAYSLSNIGNGVWEIELDADQINHGDLYKLARRKWRTHTRLCPPRGAGRKDSHFLGASVGCGSLSVPN